MSALAAIVDFSGAPLPVEAMAEALAWLTPEPARIERGGKAALAQRELFPSDGAPCPLFDDADHLVLAMDGYIANRDDLTRLLRERGAPLRQDDDAELALQAYMQWGEGFAQHVEGEFAIAIWDARREALILARDHQGLRPLYYHHAKDRLLAASDIAGILAALPEAPSPNRGFIAEVMANQWYSAAETIWQGIERVPAAHMLVFDRTGLRANRYWSPPTGPAIRHRTEADYFAEYREVFATCVAQAARTDRPLAIEVSGGLDSSAVFAMAERLQAGGSLPSPAIRGYTLEAPTGSAADERAFVDALRAQTDIVIEGAPLARPPLAWFDDAARQARDLPPYPNAAMSLDLDAALVADGCRVKLTGHGGDQWLDGSRRHYREAIAARDWRALARGYRADIADVGFLAGSEQLLRAALRPLAPGWVRSAFRRASGETFFPPDWLSVELREELGHRRKRYLTSLPADDTERTLAEKHGFPYLAIGLDMTARQNAASGCEARHPLLSRRFVEYAARLPQGMLLRGDTGKYIHRRAMADLLPGKIARRRTKADFSMVFESHAEALATQPPLKPLAESGLVDPHGLARLLNACRDAPIDRSPFWEVWGVYAVGAALCGPANR